MAVDVGTEAGVAAIVLAEERYTANASPIGRARPARATRKVRNGRIHRP
jgi:hypothetical protein